MKLVWVSISLMAALAIQSQVSLFGVVPNLTAVVAYYLCIKGGAARGVALGSIIGIIEDSVGGSILGPNLLSKGMVGFLASFSSGSLFRWTPLLGMISIFVLTVMDGGVVYVSRSIFGTSPGPLSSGILTLLAQGLLNLGVGIFVKPQNVD
jgi:rod shape-determining protein MreD